MAWAAGRAGRSASRWHLVVPAAASAAVALVVAGFLAHRLAIRADELFTGLHARDDGPGDLWRSYRDAHDTLPPGAYLLSWAFAQVLGAGTLAVRIPSVMAWGVAAGALSFATRRAGGWASFAAGLVPSATALVFLGAFARPYALPLAALSAGLVCWQRAAEVEPARRWLVGAFILFVVATALHYLSAPVPLVLGGVAWWGQPDRRRPGARAVVPVAAVAVAMAASAVLVPRAIDDQSRIASSAGVADLAAFWPSTLRPVLLPLVLGAFVVGVVALRHRGRPSVAPDPGPVLDRDLQLAAVAMVVAVPVFAVVVMALTSGVYVHRYAVGALIGLALLAGQAIGWTDRRQRGAGPVLAALVLLGIGLAAGSVATSTVSARDARSLAADLGVTGDGPTTVVLDPYDYALIRTTGAKAVRNRLRLGSPGPIAATEVVDLDDLLRCPGRGTAIDLVGEQAAVDQVAADHPEWSAIAVGQAWYTRPDVDRELVRVRVECPT